MTTDVSVIDAQKEKHAATLIPPWLMVVLAIISLQIGASIAKQLFDVVNSQGVVFLRTFVGGIVMFLLLRPRLTGYSFRVYRMALIYGVSIAINMLTFYTAISMLPQGIVVAIAFLGPLAISVAGSRRLTDLLWVGLALTGILLLSPITDASLNTLGVFIAFLTAAGWANFILVTKRASLMLPGNTMLVMGMMCAGLVIAPFGAVEALNLVSHPEVIPAAVAVIILSSVIPFLLEYVAFKRMSPRVLACS